MVKTGLDNLVDSPPDFLSGKRLGLLANPASVRRDYTHARDLFHHRFGERLTCLFSPQHGFFADKQDNMIESDHMKDPKLGIPVFSLYGETRRPTAAMFDHLDVLVVDLLDVGTRVYTFMYTLSYCMEAAKAWGKTIVVLDRPNPVGGVAVEGHLLNEAYRSFVGRYPLPMRHGLTMGELARLFNDHFGIGCDLHVVPMTGWTRGMHYPETGLPWVAPSPNLPTATSASVYPGQVIFEGTNVSEGRGTTQPFELSGAPYADPEALIAGILPEFLEGVHLRPVCFEPTSNKWQGHACRGVQIHVLDPDRYQPYALSLSLLKGFMVQGGDRFTWKSPPYEYEYEKLPMDLILGDSNTRKRLEEGESIRSIRASWQDDCGAFIRLKQRFHLYD
jgi:uncharacterized protein YbbC (DUF1343 family)